MKFNKINISIFLSSHTAHFYIINLKHFWSKQISLISFIYRKYRCLLFNVIFLYFALYFFTLSIVVFLSYNINYSLMGSDFFYNVNSIFLTSFFVFLLFFYICILIYIIFCVIWDDLLFVNLIFLILNIYHGYKYLYLYIWKIYFVSFYLGFLLFKLMMIMREFVDHFELKKKFKNRILIIFRRYYLKNSKFKLLIIIYIWLNILIFFSNKLNNWNKN